MYEQNIKSAAYQPDVYTQMGAIQGMPAQTVPGTHMDNLCNRLAVALDAANNITARLSQIDQRLTGGELSKEGAVGNPRPVPNGHIAQLSMGFDELMGRFEIAQRLLNRLQDAI